MPIYEFRCPSCEERFEQLAAAGTEAASCSVCGAAGAPRVLSAPSLPLRQMTPAQRRRLEDRRGIDRGGAKQRFLDGRRARKRSGRRGGSGGDG